MSFSRLSRHTSAIVTNSYSGLCYIINCAKRKASGNSLQCVRNSEDINGRGEIHPSILAQLPSRRNWEHILLCDPAMNNEDVLIFCCRSVFLSLGDIFWFPIQADVSYLSSLEST
jgi:hypothetical protein